MGEHITTNRTNITKAELRKTKLCQRALQTDGWNALCCPRFPVPPGDQGKRCWAGPYIISLGSVLFMDGTSSTMLPFQIESNNRWPSFHQRTLNQTKTKSTSRMRLQTYQHVKLKIHCEVVLFVAGGRDEWGVGREGIAEWIER